MCPVKVKAVSVERVDAAVFICCLCEVTKLCWAMILSNLSEFLVSASVEGTQYEPVHNPCECFVFSADCEFFIGEILQDEQLSVSAQEARDVLLSNFRVVFGG